MKNKGAYRAAVSRIVSEGISLSEKSFSNLVNYEVLESGLPIAIIIDAAEELLRGNYVSATKKLIESVNIRGDKNPLFDEFEAKYYWSIDEREKGLEMAQRAYQQWDRDYILDLVEVMIADLDKDHSGNQ